MRQKSPNPIDKHVGSRVRMGRMMLDMSQTNLGDALGLTFQQVQKYEKGTNRISATRHPVCSRLACDMALLHVAVQSRAGRSRFPSARFSCTTLKWQK